VIAPSSSDPTVQDSPKEPTAIVAPSPKASPCRSCPSASATTSSRWGSGSPSSTAPSRRCGPLRWEGARRGRQGRLLVPHELRSRPVRLDGPRQLVFFPDHLHPDRAAFWFLMQTGMVVGFFPAWPTNVWLVRKGVKEASSQTPPDRPRPGLLAPAPPRRGHRAGAARRRRRDSFGRSVDSVRAPRYGCVCLAFGSICLQRRRKAGAPRRTPEDVPASPPPPPPVSLEQARTGPHRRPPRRRRCRAGRRPGAARSPARSTRRGGPGRTCPSRGRGAGRSR
jgi:hypothetical protein